MRDLEYINSYNGTKATLLLNLPQATTEEVGRELHRIAKTYRNEAYSTVGTYAGLNLLVRSEYSIDGTFDRNTFFVEGISGLKYRCGLSGALPLGFVESAQYPHGALSKLPLSYREATKGGRADRKRNSYIAGHHLSPVE